MRLLVVTENFPPTHGGIATFLHHLCCQMAERGHQVHVHVLGTSRADGQKAWPGDQQVELASACRFRVHRIALPVRAASVFIARHLLAATRGLRPDVMLLGHEACSEALGMWLVGKLLGTPSLMLVHGRVLQWRLHDLRGMDGLWARLALRQASLVLANSSFTQAELVREGVSPERTSILHPGVDGRMFHPGIGSSRVEDRHGLKGRKVVLSVGRLIARKNFEAVLRAMPMVLSRFPSLAYVIVGDGPERGRVASLVNSLGLSEHVVLTGALDHQDLPAYYCASDVFAMPSLDFDRDNETFGMVYLEANACSVPVIGGRAGGIGDAVIDRETGLLVDPRRVDQLATAMLRLLSDRDYAQSLGRNGRLRVEREFTWEIVGEQLEGYLEAAATHGSRGTGWQGRCTSPC